MKNIFYKVMAIAAVSACSQFFIVPTYAATLLPVNVNNLLQVINQRRQSNNLPPLHINNLLNDAAYNHLTDMETQNYFGHTSPDGMSPWDFIEEAGYRYRTAGENLAKDYIDPVAMVRTWLTSDTHRANLLSNTFTDIGIASGKINGHIVTVALFASPFSAASSTAPSDQPIVAKPTVAGVQTTVPSVEKHVPQADNGQMAVTAPIIPDSSPIMNNQLPAKSTAPLFLIISIIFGLGSLAITSWWIMAAMI